MSTERPSPRYSEIDSWEPADSLDSMIDGQFAAVAAVRARVGRSKKPPRRWKRGCGIAAD